MAISIVTLSKYCEYRCQNWTVIIVLMTGPQQPAANQRGKYTPSFPAARMWRGAGAGVGAGLPPNLELGH